MSRARLVLIAAPIAALVIVVALLLNRPSPEEQVAATFDRLGEALAGLSAGDAFAQLAPTYDCSWLLDDSPASDDRERLAQRRAAQRQVFAGMHSLRQSNRQPVLAVTLHEVTGTPPDLTAIVSLRLQLDDGGRTYAEVTRHRFTLISTGWLLPAARINGHDPLPL